MRGNLQQGMSRPNRTCMYKTRTLTRITVHRPNLLLDYAIRPIYKEKQSHHTVTKLTLVITLVNWISRRKTDEPKNSSKQCSNPLIREVNLCFR